MEIVFSLGFADAIFRRERSDDRKYVCGSQARESPELGLTLEPVDEILWCDYLNQTCWVVLSLGFTHILAFYKTKF